MLWHMLMCLGRGRAVGQHWAERQGLCLVSVLLSSLGPMSYTMRVLKRCSCHPCSGFGACVSQYGCR